MKNLTEKIWTVAYLIAIVTFWVFFLTVSYFDRFAKDDYSMIGLFDQYGPLNTAIHFYKTWSGAFWGILIQTSVLGAVKNCTSLIFYNLFLLLFVSSSVYYLAFQVNKKFTLQLSPLDVFIVTQFLLMAFFYGTFAYADNWFWVVGSTAYIFPICWFMLSLGLLLQYYSSRKQWQLILCLFLSFILGNYPINYIVPIVMFLGAMVVYDFAINKKIDKVLVFYLVAITTSLFINIIAPGNYVRKQKFAAMYVTSHKDIEPSFIHQLIFAPFTVVKKLLLDKEVCVLIFCLSLLPILSKLKNSAKEKTTYLKASVALLIVLIGLIVVNCAITGIAIKKWLHYRTMLVVIIVLISVNISVALLFYSQFRTYIRREIFLIFIVAAVYLNLKTLKVQYPIVSQYAAAHDLRMAQIMAAKNDFKGVTLELDSLPSSGLLYSAEIDKDTSKFPNGDMRDALHLPFCIAVK